MTEFEAVDEIMEEDLSAVSSYAIAHIEKEQVYAALPQVFTPGGKVRKNPEYEAQRSDKSTIERAMIAAKVEMNLQADPHAQLRLFLPAGVLLVSMEITAFMARERLFVDMAMKGWNFTAQS